MADFTIKRVAPGWKSNTTKLVENYKDILDVIQAKVPVGTLPKTIMNPTELEFIGRMLQYIPINKYDNTDETEDVKVWGRPFVDSPSINDHLKSSPDTQFYTLVTPIFFKLKQYFENKGFNVAPLIDSSTMLPYSYMVARMISVPDNCIKEDGNKCTVLHFDDFLRDAMLKTDFSESRLPIGITPNNYSQFSVCIPLGNGFFRPDHLEVYNYRYFPKDKQELKNWRVVRERINGVKSHTHIPKTGEVYLFNTQNCHDVLGGDSRSKRINLSVFFLYVEETNTLYPYN